MTHWTGTPVYAQIANDYRNKIIEGSLADGTKLPSESELMQEYDVSRIVARQAISVLRNEGLVVSHPGKGSFVTSHRQIERLVRSRYRRRREQLGPFASDVHRAGETANVEAHSAPTPASHGVAARLHIEPGTLVMRTAYRFLAGNRPIQVSTSYEPYDLVKGTPVERPEEGPLAGLGVTTRMDSIGIQITEAIEAVTTRAPLPWEVDALDIPAGVHILGIERTYLADELPVETCDIVVPGDRYGLVYRIPVTD